jgi:hypothetical protein
MRRNRWMEAAMAAALFTAVSVHAQDFDACTVFTQEDAQVAMGAAATPEPVNPKVKRPKVVPTCTYSGNKEGKPTTASVQFRFGKTDAEAKSAFDAARLQFQTKPMLVGETPAFWSAKQGQLYVVKGRTWLSIGVGSEKISERNPEAARKLADVLLKKI